jgi:hypothetical protein
VDVRVSGLLLLIRLSINRKLNQCLELTERMLVFITINEKDNVALLAEMFTVRGCSLLFFVFLATSSIANCKILIYYLCIFFTWRGLGE